MNQTFTVCLPDIGDFTDVPVVEIPVTAGDRIEQEDTIVIVESDKATMDIPSPQSGVIVKVVVREGDKISAGSAILELEMEETAGQAPTLPEVAVPSEPPKPSPPSQSAAAPESPTPRGAAKSLIYASPSIRRFARTLGVSAEDVTGTGSKGRVLREDIETFVKLRLSEKDKGPAGIADWPKVDHAKFGPVEVVELSRIGKISARAMTRNAAVIPHVCNFDEADVTDLDMFRKTLNNEANDGDEKVTMLAFTIKAVVSALQKFPKFNSSFEDEAIVLKKYWNIGFAADTPGGLVVPVIKNADQKGLRSIANETSVLAQAGRAGKLKATDMQGATFTISSLGGVGGTNFTPIINAPEVAILGMTRAAIKPVWNGKDFDPRLIQPLSLSWDHRVVNGVEAAMFLRHIKDSLSDFRRVSV